MLERWEFIAKMIWGWAVIVVKERERAAFKDGKDKSVGFGETAWVLGMREEGGMGKLKNDILIWGCVYGVAVLEGFGMRLKSSFLRDELRRLWDFKERCLLRKCDMYKDCPRREYRV